MSIFLSLYPPWRESGVNVDDDILLVLDFLGPVGIDPSEDFLGGVRN